VVPLWGHARVAAVSLALGMGMASLALPGTAPGVESGPTGPPAASGTAEITGYDVALTVRNDGVVHVRESISYDFGDTPGNGVVRVTPYRRGNRVYRITGITAESTTGAPARPEATRILHDLRIWVGGGRSVTGLQAYVLQYDVIGLLTPYADRDELTWNAVGTGWDVSMGEVDVRLDSPARILAAKCVAGRPGLTTRCPAERLGKARVALFSQDGLAPHEGLVLTVRLAKGVVRVPPPRYARGHLLVGPAGFAVLGAGAAVAAAARLTRRRLSRTRGRRGILVLGTITGVAGVIAVMWDVADDIVAGGLWSASIGDPALGGLGAVLAGAVLLTTARAGTPHDPSESGQERPRRSRVARPPR
jgi:hypothetical protein